MNDPREAMDWRITLVGSAGRSRDDVDRLRKEFNDALKRRSKVVCFTKDDEGGSGADLERGWAHPRMWAQYAENHTGVCLVFDRAAIEQQMRAELQRHGEMFSGDVIYTDEPPVPVLGAGLPFDVHVAAIEQLGVTPAVSQHLRHHSESLFRTKLRDWADEHEYRFIVFCEDEDPIYVPIASTLVAVLVGWQFHEVYEPSLTALCEVLHAPVRRCAWDNGFPTIDAL
jgi:hypothetical protein